MDALKDQIMGGGSSEQKTGEQKPQEKKDQGFMDQMYNKVNTAAGGGKKSEKDEDMLDKGIDYVQEHVLGQGQQSNETAFEQAKDDKIADFVRSQYQSKSGGSESKGN